jgi:hypothetical protein
MGKTILAVLIFCALAGVSIYTSIKMVKYKGQVETERYIAVEFIEKNIRLSEELSAARREVDRLVGELHALANERDRLQMSIKAKDDRK